jgi:hypothetical protein
MTSHVALLLDPVDAGLHRVHSASCRRQERSVVAPFLPDIPRTLTSVRLCAHLTARYTNWLSLMTPAPTNPIRTSRGSESSPPDGDIRCVAGYVRLLESTAMLVRTCRRGWRLHSQFAFPIRLALVVNAMPSLWLSTAAALACVLFSAHATCAASNADYTSTTADKYGSVAIQSQGFVAYGDLDTPAVVNLALSAGHYRLNDIFTVCEVGKHAVVSDDPNDPRTVNACNGAEFFLRISPGMEPHIALTLLKDESSLHSFRGSNLAADIDYSTWPSTNGHGVTKMCGDWTLDECYVNRAMTYTTSWKDVRQPERPGPIVIRGSHESPAAVTVPRNTSSSSSSPNNNVTSSVLSSHPRTPPIATAAAPMLPADLPSSSPYRVDVLKRLPPGVNFESRMAGSFYRLHLNAMHFLIEVDVPEELAGHAFVQLEVRLTGTNSMTVGTRGLLGTMGLLLAIGFGLMGVKKFALARYRTFEVLTPLEIWTFRGRLGRAVENAIVPEARLPEIIGKPVTPTRLAPKPPTQDTAAPRSQPVAASGEGLPSGVEGCSEERPAGKATEEEVSNGPATATSGATGAGGWATLVARLRGTLENAPRPRLPALPVPHSGRERLAQHDDADADANAEELEANHSVVNEHAALTGASTTAAVLDNRDETDDRSAALAGGAASTDAAPTATTTAAAPSAAPARSSSIRAKASRTSSFAASAKTPLLATTCSRRATARAPPSTSTGNV